MSHFTNAIEGRGSGIKASEQARADVCTRNAGWLAAGQASHSVSGPRPIPGADIGPLPFQAVMVQAGMRACLAT